MDEIFDVAFEHTMSYEGTFSHDDVDEGGPTIYGICSHHFPKVCSRIMGLPRAEGRVEAKKFYYEEFWKRLGLQRIKNPQLAVHTFDATVNPGPGAAIRLLQQSVSDLTGEPLSVDGVLGPKTAAAINKCKRPDILMKMFSARRVLYYCDLVRDTPDKRKFLAGWIRRS